MRIDINEKYQPLWISDARFFVVTGGRGSGKSFAISLNADTTTYEKGHTILYTRYTLTSANISIIPEFYEKIEMMGKLSDFRITKDEIINLTTGSNIIFRGIRTASGNQTAALKSIQGLTTWILDEAEELPDEATFNKIARSVRQKGMRNRIIIAMNPTTMDHWIYKRFFEEPNVEPGFNGRVGNVQYIHTTYKDNKENLSEDFLQDVFETKIRRPDVYEHEILGGWKHKAEGVIFKNWKIGDFVPTELMCYGQDYGFSDDPTVLVKVALDRKGRKLYLKEIYGDTGMNADQIARKNIHYAGNSLIMADSADPRLIADLRIRGCNIQPIRKKHGSILSGINMMQDLDIIVDKNSHNLIKEFNNYVWKDTEKPLQNGYDHYIDASRYATMKLYGRKNFGKYLLR